MKSLKFDYYKVSKSINIQAFNSGPPIPSKRVVKVNSYEFSNDILDAISVTSIDDIPVGVTYEGIPTYFRGTIVRTGVIEEIDTSSSTPLSPVYFTSSGDLTLVNTGSGRVGWVIEVSIQGKVFIDISNYNISNKQLNLSEPSTTISASGTVSDLNTSINVRVNLSNTSILKSILAPTGERNTLILTNTSLSNNLTINNLDESVSSENRIITGTNRELVILPSSSILLFYDKSILKWRVLGGSGGGNHNSLFELQGGDALNRYHSDQPINKVDNVQFNSVSTNELKIKNLTYPSVDGQVGQAIITDGLGGLTFGDVNSNGNSTSTIFTLPSSVSIPLGSPVYYGISGWGLAIATSEISAGQYVISKVTSSGSVTEYVAVAMGEVVLPASGWDAITNGVGGLTPGKQYYTSSLYPGKISLTPGIINAPVLKALSNTKAFVSFTINNTESGMGDTFYRDTIVTNSSTSFVNLTYAPAGKAYVWLTIDGVLQSGQDFNLAGNTITLGETIPSGTIVDILYARTILLADVGAINRMVSFTETVTTIPKTTFNLPSVPSNSNSVIAFVGGSIQDPSKFSISGNILYFSDPVPVGSKVVAYILNSSGIANTLDTFVSRQTRVILNNSTASITSIFESQISACYRVFAIEDPRISAIIFLKHNGNGFQPDVRVDSNSSSISIFQGTPGKLNIYISSNILTFQNLTGTTLNLRLYREI